MRTAKMLAGLANSFWMSGWTPAPPACSAVWAQ
jgi:hypothetical protein